MVSDHSFENNLLLSVTSHFYYLMRPALADLYDPGEDASTVSERLEHVLSIVGRLLLYP